MNIDELNEKVQTQFRGRLRVRQSAFEDRYLIEEHTGRGTITTIADLKSNGRVQFKQRFDARIRARDGYTQVMEIRHGAAFGCVACGHRLMTPVNEMKEVRCRCGHQNYAVFFTDLYSLLNHLRLIDPAEGADLKARVRREDEKKASRDYHEDRMIHSEGGAQFKDALINQLPSFGYSGKTAAWVDAPASPKG